MKIGDNRYTFPSIAPTSEALMYFFLYLEGGWWGNYPLPKTTNWYSNGGVDGSISPKTTNFRLVRGGNRHPQPNTTYQYLVGVGNGEIYTNIWYPYQTTSNSGSNVPQVMNILTRYRSTIDKHTYVYILAYKYVAVAGRTAMTPA